ncbi:hypothetical protein VDQ74_14020 [Xanthomonas campestris pv. campestris]|nr:hypothetical protein [Xanthomonas campestris pv. campestris]
MAGKENVIQGAIVAALEVYCDRNWLGTDVFAPYANQQGSGFNQYCADLFARLGRSKIILLEVKELDVTKSTGAVTLPSYSPHQHVADWDFEDLGVPIRYAYAGVEWLSYLKSFREKQWPNTTLFKVHICKPSELFADYSQQSSAQPDMVSHENLLGWLLSEPGVQLGAVGLLSYFAEVKSHDLRNRILIVASATSGGMQINSMSATAARELVVKVFRMLRQREGKDNFRTSIDEKSLQEVLSVVKNIAKEIDYKRGVVSKINSRKTQAPDEFSANESPSDRSRRLDEDSRKIIEDRIGGRLRAKVTKQKESQDFER